MASTDRRDESVDERATVQRLGPEQAAIRAFDGARTRRHDARDRPATAISSRANHQDPDIARMFGMSPARRVVDGLTRLGESVGTSLGRLLRSQSGSESGLGSSRQMTTLFGSRGDALDTFEVRARERSENVQPIEPDLDSEHDDWYEVVAPRDGDDEQP